MTDEKAAKFKTFWRSIQWIITPQESYNILSLLSSAWNKSTFRLDEPPKLVNPLNHHCCWEFHADHIKMRRPDLDIMLTNGNGYMVEDGHFREYLSNAKELRFVGIFKYLLFSLFLTYPTEAILLEFQHQSAICKRAKGKPLLVMSNLIKKPINLVIAVK